MEEWMQWQNSMDSTNIEIIIHCIENIIIKEDISISFVIEHNGIILGESSPMLIKSEINDEFSIYRIDFIVNLPVAVKNKESINAIVSVPLLIKAKQTSENDRDDRSSAATVEVKKKSIFSAKSAPVSPSPLLGLCNFDLMPLMLGDTSYTEKLILETPTFTFDGESVSWQNLPRLTMTASLNHSPFLDALKTLNFLSITVESIYNLPQTFTDNFTYVAGTIAFLDSEVPEHIIFGEGAWTKYRDIERTKRWNTLRHVQNRAQLSKYKLDCDFKGIRNEYKEEFDLQKKSCADIPRIEFNSVNRCIVWEKGIEAMKRHINKYRYWPFQFEIRNKRSPRGSKTQVYQCYVDVSELLFPGRSKCRIVGQLFEFNATDITEKVGLEENIFVAEAQRKEVGKLKKSKSSKHTQSIVSEGETISTGLIAVNEEPTIIVLEMELNEPLIRCRIEEDFSHLLDEIMPKVEKKPPFVHTGDLAQAQYIYTVQSLAEAITESYRDFCEKNKGKNPKERSQEDKFCFDPESDEITCFVQYLYKTGAYLAVRKTLKMKIPGLIDQKFDLPKNLVDCYETQNLIASVYTYLVEQMHVAINKMVEGRHTQDFEPVVDLKMMDFYADECFELGDVDAAKQHYTKAIAIDKKNPHAWTKYGIFLKNIGETERAKECCLEAITLRSRYVIALLVYAMILFENREYREAEIFFRAVTNFYPRFCEGWAILHLFYIRTEYYPGIDLTYRIAEKCMQDKNQTVTLDYEPLSWTTAHCPKNNLYMRVATFLLKLKFCEFAGIAIAEEMGNSNRSTHILYYMAVEHYLSGKYEDALSHLNEAKCNYGMDFSISSLMGHCYFKMGDLQKGIECYQFAHMLFDRPDDLHLVEVRLGYHYYNTGEYERARKILLNVCNTSPTSLSWLGVGISYYELSQFREAELSLLEANRIDNHNAEVWGYLCLLNMTFGGYDEFSQCYAEMIKNNLKNRKLLLRITNLMETLGYAPPNLTELEDHVEDYSTEESEEQFENEWHTNKINANA